MKKVVFEGIINGEKFDNVQDYNKKMTELVKNNEQISASSITKMNDEFDDSEDKTPAPEQVVENKENISRDDLLPYFNDGFDGYYLDKLVTGDDTIDRESISKVIDTIKEAREKFDRACKSDMFKNSDEILDFIYDVKDIRSTIDSDIRDTKTSLKNINDDLVYLNKQKKVLENSLNFIDIINTYYNGIFESLKKYLLS